MSEDCCQFYRDWRRHGLGREKAGPRYVAASNKSFEAAPLAPGNAG